MMASSPAHQLPTSSPAISIINLTTFKPYPTSSLSSPISLLFFLSFSLPFVCFLSPITVANYFKIAFPHYQRFSFSNPKYPPNSSLLSTFIPLPWSQPFSASSLFLLLIHSSYSSQTNVLFIFIFSLILTEEYFYIDFTLSGRKERRKRWGEGRAGEGGKEGGRGKKETEREWGRERDIDWFPLNRPQPGIKPETLPCLGQHSNH